MLMFVPTLVMVTTALGTTAPVASFTSPVIVAVSCCASTVSGQANNNTKQIMLLMQRENGLNISFLLWVRGTYTQPQRDEAERAFYMPNIKCQLNCQPTEAQCPGWLLPNQKTNFNANCITLGSPDRVEIRPAAALV